MSRFAVSTTPIHALHVIERQRIADERGSLSRLFCSSELESAGWGASIAQINYTVTRKQGAVRGFHYQRPPHAEMKLISCLRGEVWDVAVDLRHGSRTFLRWHAERLSGENQKALLIPQGFAHGFQAMTDEVELLYLHSAHYQPAAEGGLHFRDPRLGVAWPLPVTAVSARDDQFPALSPDFVGLTL
jgi:dTDP-4-dehydrorhamnose 3,5-epimerase